MCGNEACAGVGGVKRLVEEKSAKTRPLAMLVYGSLSAEGGEYLYRVGDLG